MNNQNRLNFLIDTLLDNALNTFQTSEQGKLLNEKVEQMNEDCQTMFRKNEEEFVYECFELLNHISNQKERHLYCKGMLDCVAILKELGVLS